MTSTQAGRRRRPTYADVAATLALLIATTSGAYAAATIGSNQIKSNAVKTRHLAAGAVRAPDLAAGAVVRSRLGPSSVTSDKIRAGAVTNDDLGANAVTPDKIYDGGVTRADISNGAVGTDELGPEAVTTHRIGNDAVTDDKLAGDVIRARAFGDVYYNANVTNAHMLVSNNVSHPATGVYCIGGLNFSPKKVVAVSANGGNAGTHHVDVWGVGQGSATTSPCSSNTQIQIRLFQLGGGADDGNFSIVIF